MKYLHGHFVRIAAEVKAGAKIGAAIRALARRRCRFFPRGKYSAKNFEHLYYIWEKSSSPQTLVRNYRGPDVRVPALLLLEFLTRLSQSEFISAAEALESLRADWRRGVPLPGVGTWPRGVDRSIRPRISCIGTSGTFGFRSFVTSTIGTACSYRRKAIEMRGRIQDALQPGHLMLVLDESHFLMPTSARSERTTPKRMDWLRTALIDFGVPVAMISTPQFFERQCERFVKAGWNANQIQRRLVRTARLPDALDEADMIAVVTKYFPSVPIRLAKQVAVVVGSEVGYLTIASNLRKEVDFLVSRRPGKSENELLECALRAKCEEFGRPFPEIGKQVSGPLQTARNATARAVQPSNRITFNQELVQV